MTRGVQAPEAGIERAEGRYSVSGAAISLYRPQFTARVSTPEAMAREYLASRVEQFGLAKADATTLARTTLRAGREFSVVRFTQMQDGLRVYGSDIAVSVKPNGQIIHVANSLVANVGPAAGANTTASASAAAEAATIAQRYLGAPAPSAMKPERMVFATSSGSRVVWRVRAAAGPDTSHGDWEVLVDAQTGEVLRAEDKALNATGNGTIWTPDPLSYKKVAYGGTYVDGNNADTADLTAALVPVTLENITQNGANYELSGPYIVCANIEAPADAACPSQPSTDFSVTRSAMTFDAVMVYYHISTYLKYVNETLGIPALPLRHAGGVKVDPHGLSGDDNSHYVPSTEILAFGQGGVDDAQDADVIIHELGHGIHDWITGGHLSTVQGLSEGFGDFTAGSYSRDFPNQWTPTDAAYSWVFSWDGHNPFWAGRILNYQLNHAYPNIGSSPGGGHTPGQYWSSCNLVARGAIQALEPTDGAKIFDKAYFKGLSMTGGSTNQKDAAQAIIDAAAALGYPQAQIDAIGAAYNAGNQGGNTSCTYAVTVPTVSNAPVVDVDTTPLEATAEAGGTASASLAVGNTGSADLTWNIDTSDDAACTTPATTQWLSATPANGTVAAGAADAEVAIAFDSASLAAGEYTTNLCVHSNDPATAVVAVPVTFTVTADDTIFKDGFEGSDTGTCEPAQLFADTSFEETGPGTNPTAPWTVDESIAGSPLCDAGCDDNGTITAHTGDWFVWFGGYQEQNTALVSQSVVLPSGQPRFLNYWMMNQIAGDPGASLTISIDDTEVSTVAPGSGETEYTVRSLEVPATYLDGQSHTVKFDWSSPAANGENASAIIDDVTLDCAAPVGVARPQSHPGRGAHKRAR